jgi:hypothetical protein
MSEAPITVHRPSASSGRQVTAHSHGRFQILGTAFSDHDLVVFIEAAGIEAPDMVLYDPRFVEWRGGRAHRWTAA